MDGQIKYTRSQGYDIIKDKVCSDITMTLTVKYVKHCRMLPPRMKLSTCRFQIWEKKLIQTSCILLRPFPFVHINQIAGGELGKARVEEKRIHFSVKVID